MSFEVDSYDGKKSLRVKTFKVYIVDGQQAYLEVEFVAHRQRSARVEALEFIRTELFGPLNRDLGAPVEINSQTGVEEKIWWYHAKLPVVSGVPLTTMAMDAALQFIRRCGCNAFTVPTILTETFVSTEGSSASFGCHLMLKRAEVMFRNASPFD